MTSHPKIIRNKPRQPKSLTNALTDLDLLKVINNPTASNIGKYITVGLEGSPNGRPYSLLEISQSIDSLTFTSTDGNKIHFLASFLVATCIQDPDTDFYNLLGREDLSTIVRDFLDINNITCSNNDLHVWIDELKRGFKRRLLDIIISNPSENIGQILKRHSINLAAFKPDLDVPIARKLVKPNTNIEDIRTLFFSNEQAIKDLFSLADSNLDDYTFGELLRNPSRARLRVMQIANNIIYCYLHENGLSDNINYLWLIKNERNKKIEDYELTPYNITKADVPNQNGRPIAYLIFQLYDLGYPPNTISNIIYALMDESDLTTQLKSGIRDYIDRVINYYHHPNSFSLGTFSNYDDLRLNIKADIEN